MLTDDDLTNELSAAFRDRTGDLSYSGRRRPRRTAAVVVPAAVGLSLAAVAIAATLNAGSDPAAQQPAADGSPTQGATATPAKGSFVTEKVEIAGYSFSYLHAKGDTTPPLIATMATELPDGLTPISAPNGAKAWVGKDPNGDNAIYVQAPTRNGGNLFELHSPIWTQDELVDLFHNGTPKTVPLVKD